MPVVEKTSGGRVYLRPLDRRFGIGDRVDVDEELAMYLTAERGDFEIVDNLRGTERLTRDEWEDEADKLEPVDLDEDTLVDTLDAASDDSTTGDATEGERPDDETAPESEVSVDSDESEESDENRTDADVDGGGECTPTYEGEDYDPGEYTVDEIQEHVDSTKDQRWLSLVRSAEADGKERTTALEAIDDRLDELED